MSSGPRSGSLFGDSESEQDELQLPSRLWRRSESPIETFSDADGADEDGKWPVQIVGEEVDGEGNIRYEARWDNWSRADGSCTTWDNGLLNPEDIRLWEKSQKLRRNKLAKESLDISIWSTLDIHNFDTRLRAQAYDEKLEIRTKNPLCLGEKMARLLAEKKAMMDVDTPNVLSGHSSSKRITEYDSDILLEDWSAGTSVRLGRLKRRRTQDTLDQSVGSNSSPKNGSRIASSYQHSKNRVTESLFSSSPRSSMFSSTIRNPTPASVTSISTSRSVPSKGKKKNQRPLVTDVHSYSSRSHKPQSQAMSKYLKRDALEKAWNSVTRSYRAAPITLVNEVDDEEIPPLPPLFQYIETGYAYSESVPEFLDDLFVRCDCHHCASPEECSCQDPSELVDDDGRKQLAYTSDGLFAFNVPRGIEVIECNKFCQCDPYTCPNRVAQQPRDVPIEIFKTINCGWGARSPVDIPRGKVLGIYAGKLSHRALAGLTRYGFDLDMNENLADGDPADNAYTVVAESYGNWTRFVNHSCDSNLSTYPVVYDTLPGTNMPYLAYVAIKDIFGGEELTLDYDPAAGEARIKGKGKGKIKRPPGARDCMCGAWVCRGWVRL